MLLSSRRCQPGAVKAQQALGMPAEFQRKTSYFQLLRPASLSLSLRLSLAKKSRKARRMGSNFSFLKFFQKRIYESLLGSTDQSFQPFTS